MRVATAPLAGIRALTKFKHTPVIMSSNGSSASDAAFAWKFGFANQKGKWLTAEKFGFKINASGTALKSKQVWVIEHGPNPEEVYIMSSQNRYMSTDKYGNLTCDTEDEDKQDNNRFAVEYNANGQWAFRSVQFGTYMGGEEDHVHCKSKAAEWWHIQLAIHPQVNMLNSNRKRYCHLVEDEVHGSQLIPWGSDAMITLDYIDHKYGIKTSDGRYLNPEGMLQTGHENALYTLQVKSGGLAFRSHDGRFLTNIGSTATLKARNKKVTKDELFLIRDSQPQIILQGSNGKRVSIMQGIDVSSNQDDEDINDKEIFQLEFDRESKKWHILAFNGKYWTMQGTGVQAAADDGSEALLRGQRISGAKPSLFELEQLGNSRVALKASNGKYVTIKMTGALNASSDSCGDKEKFKMTILNRPIIILKGQFGFLGLKGCKIESNRPAYCSFQLSQSEDGNYKFKGPNGQFWAMDGKQVVCTAVESQAAAFQLELLGNSQLCIKTTEGAYLRGENNGVFTASGSEVKADTTYEF